MIKKYSKKRECECPVEGHLQGCSNDLLTRVAKSIREGLKGFIGKPNTKKAQAEVKKILVQRYQELFKMLDKNHPLKAQKGDYCELLDENEPEGIVVFRRKNGTPTMFMLRADYEDIKKMETPK